MKRKFSFLLSAAVLAGSLVMPNAVNAESYRYSDTTEVVAGVEVHRTNNLTYWAISDNFGTGNLYLTHDAYSDNAALMVVAEERDGKKAAVTNIDMHAEWTPGDPITKGRTYKYTYMVKPLVKADGSYKLEEELTWFREIDANYEEAQKVTPTYYDPDTNQVVSGNFENKWYRAEAEITFNLDPERADGGNPEAKGISILSASTILIDDIRGYLLEGDNWTLVEECNLVIDWGFETNANKDYTVSEPVVSENKYSDTTEVVSGVEIHRANNLTYWAISDNFGTGNLYLTHDSYNDAAALMVVGEEKDGKKAAVTNINMHAEWTNGDPITKGRTYKYTYMVKPLVKVDGSYELEEELSWFREIDLNYETAQKVKPTYYDPETNQVVSGNFENKWYRAEAEITFNLDAESGDWANPESKGISILTASTILIDDIRGYLLEGDNWTLVEECNLVIDWGFETDANKDYTVNVQPVKSVPTVDVAAVEEFTSGTGNPAKTYTGTFTVTDENVAVSGVIWTVGTATASATFDTVISGGTVVTGLVVLAADLSAIPQPMAECIAAE